MTRVLLSLAALSLGLFTMSGCGGEASSTTGTTGSTGGGTSGETSGSSTGSTAPMGHSVSITAKFVVEENQVAFMTPTLVVARVAPDTIVGKPYLIGIFPGGFSPGNDLPINSTWGTVPADLTISFKTPATYKDGPYDVVLVVYRTTPISEETKSGIPIDAPFPKNGDLADFNADTSVVRMGDPTPQGGVARVNVAGADGSLALENRWAKDPMDQAQALAAATNTILLLP
jgi:hypothetical protein